LSYIDNKHDYESGTSTKLLISISSLQWGDIMIEAVLGGKSLGYEDKEDILTSTVFGFLNI